MSKNISKKDTDIIAVYDGVLYEYHDESWHEKESWRTDVRSSKGQIIKSPEADAIKLMYKNCKVVESMPRLLISTSELPRVTPGIDALTKRLISIPFCNESEKKDVTKES